MRAILKFDLDDHDDRKNHLRAVTALDAFLTLHDLALRFRELEKYDSEHVSEDGKVDIDYIRTEFYRILEDRNINLDELV